MITFTLIGIIKDLIIKQHKKTKTMRKTTTKLVGFGA